MQRHRCLVQLSRDHHVVLQIAEGLRKEGSAALRAALPVTLAGRLEHLRGFAAAGLWPHFAVEEDHLFPAVRGRAAALDDLLARTLEEHARIRALMAEVDSGRATEETLDALGRLLIAHVRMEERDLFETIQRVVPPEVLDSL